MWSLLLGGRTFCWTLCAALGLGMWCSGGEASSKSSFVHLLVILCSSVNATDSLLKLFCFKKKKKEKRKRKNKHPQTFSSFFLDSEDFTICPVVWVLFYFNGIIFLAITETIACMRFKLWALLWGWVWDSFDFHFLKVTDLDSVCVCVDFTSLKL